MNKMTEIRRKLQRSLGRELPDYVWGLNDLQGLVKEYLDAEVGEERNELWSLLSEAAMTRLAIWDEGKKEGLRGIESGTRGGSREMREAASRDSGGMKKLDTGTLFGNRTRAMVEAMTALFVSLADQIPEVKEFREKVLPGGLLTADEAHALIASYAARIFSPEQFKEWSIPFVGHHAKILDSGPRGENFNPVDHWETVQVDPPGVTVTVRYAYRRKGDKNTRCTVQGGAVIPIHTYLPIEPHGDHTYPSWLWPGPVVDELYDLSVELASAFDWPLASAGNLSGTRPRSESAAWYILTGESPEVHPIEARWETKYSSTHLNPQWRIHLTIPPWMPEEEALRAIRLLRREIPPGQKMPKTATPLEVARFVWEREREDGYREPPPWTKWVEQWNETHPEHRFDSASHFRTYFFRGDAAVKGLNFQAPDFEHH